MINLSAAGLSETEATTYQTLLSKKDWKPADLAKFVGESRTNMYKILDKLVEFGLAEKFDTNKKLHYRATNPTHLIQLSQNVKKKREQAEKELELNAQQLLNDYIKIHEQPGIRFFQGKDQIEGVFTDQVAEDKPIYYMISPQAIDYYGYQQMHNLRMLAVHAKIPRFALTPDNINATRNFVETDKQFHLERTWLGSNDYTAPLEWGVYGNKVYFVTFGEDALGMVVESPSMAAGFMQIFNLISAAQRAKKSYGLLPLLATKEHPVME